MKNLFIFTCIFAIISSIMCFGFIPMLSPVNAAEEANWANDSSVSSLDGDGSKENPYKVGTAPQLAFILVKNNGHDEYFKDKYILQIQNIDISARLWSPIGTETRPFLGSYNGGGFKISGLQMKDTYNAGLFGYIKGAQLENIKLEEPAFEFENATGSLDGKSYISLVTGALAARAENSTVLTSSIIDGEINLSGQIKISAGGVIGILKDSEMSNIFSSVAIKITQNSSSYTNVGGLTGEISNGKIYNTIASNDIKVISEDSNSIVRAGGTGGYAEGVSEIFNNVFAGTIVSSGSVGGTLGSTLIGGAKVKNNKSLNSAPVGSPTGILEGQIEFNSSFNEVNNAKGRAFYESRDWLVTKEWDFDYIWEASGTNFPNLQVFESYIFTIDEPADFLSVKLGTLNNEGAFSEILSIEDSNYVYSIPYGTEFYICMRVGATGDRDFSSYYIINGLMFEDEFITSQNKEISVDEVPYSGVKIISGSKTSGIYTISTTAITANNTIAVKKFNIGTSEEPIYDNEPGSVRRDTSTNYLTSFEEKMTYGAKFRFIASAKVRYGFSHWIIETVSDDETTVTLNPSPNNPEHLPLFSNVIDITYGEGLFLKPFKLLAVFSDTTSILKIKFNNGISLKLGGNPTASEEEYKVVKNSMVKIEITVAKGLVFNPDKFAISISKLFGNFGDDYDKEIYDSTNPEFNSTDEEGNSIYFFNLNTSKFDSMADMIILDAQATVENNGDDNTLLIIILCSVGGILLIGSGVVVFVIIKKKNGGGNYY